MNLPEEVKRSLVIHSQAPFPRVFKNNSLRSGYDVKIVTLPHELTVAKLQEIMNMGIVLFWRLKISFLLK
jgi:hypothetical protein